MGWTVVMQGRYVRHLACKAYNAAEVCLDHALAPGHGHNLACHPLAYHYGYVLSCQGCLATRRVYFANH